MNFDDDDSDKSFTRQLALITSLNDVVRDHNPKMVAEAIGVFCVMNDLADDVLKRLLNLGNHRLVGVPAVAVN